MNPPPSLKPSPLLRLMILTTMSFLSTVVATTAVRNAGGKDLLRTMHSHGKPTLAWSFLPRSAPTNRPFAMMPRRSTAVRAIGSRSTLTMWGEEDVPRPKPREWNRFFYRLGFRVFRKWISREMANCWFHTSLFGNSNLWREASDKKMNGNDLPFFVGFI